MRTSQIVAVDHVVLEGGPACEPDLVWLYQDVVGLRQLRAGTEGLATASDEAWLRFRSGNLELRYRLVPRPALETVACRLVVEVASLPEAMEAMEERGVAFDRLRGLNFTDRRVSLLDPGGNRIEIKQHWPGAF
jgi:hypothetical protein